MNTQHTQPPSSILSDYYYRARIYDQSVGRFGGKDKLFIANLYMYAENNSLKYMDPTGNASWDITKGDLLFMQNSFLNMSACNSYFSSNCKNGNTYEQELARWSSENDNKLFWNTDCRDNTGKNKAEGNFNITTDKEGIFIQGNYIEVQWPSSGLISSNEAGNLIHELFHACNDAEDSLDKIGSDADTDLKNACLKRR